MSKTMYRGVFPVAPTVFDAQGRLDLDGQRRCTDFIIEAGAGGVPVIVTTTHFGSSVCAERSRKAQEAGAAMVMVMPPYHGATFRVPEPVIFDFFRAVSDAVTVPVMVQDAPVAGTPLSAAFLVRMARELPN